MWRQFAILTAMLVIGLISTAPASAAGRFDLGVIDPLEFPELDPDGSYDAVQAAGMRFVRVPVAWSSVSRGVHADATNPDDASYRWETVDKRVESITSRGLEPLLFVYSSPLWARERHRPFRKTAGAADYADFMTAAARRYKAQVTHWQVWNEPNQRQFFEDTPEQYRNLLNAAYDALHAVSDKNVVVTGGLAPFGDDTGNLAPLEFMRQFFCLSKDKTPKPTCKTEVKLDVWSHHPYTQGGPNHRSEAADHVSVGDLAKITRLLRAAEKFGHLRQPGPLRFWATEFSWETKPPDPGGVSPGLHARWVAEALYRMWQADVSAVVWFLLRDLDSKGGDWAHTFQGGMFFNTTPLYKDEKAKPVAQVLAFPFVAIPKQGLVRLWGRTPDSVSQTVTIEYRRGKRWVREKRIRADRYGIFTSTLKLRGRWRRMMRARVEGKTSRPFEVTVTRDIPVRAFGGRAA